MTLIEHVAMWTLFTASGLLGYLAGKWAPWFPARPRSAWVIRDQESNRRDEE